MCHCPYLLHKFVLLFDVPHLFELPTALLEYLNLLQGGCSPPAPQGCYTYMIMIIKMIEIYNIAPQPYISGEPMHTTSKQLHRAPHLRFFFLLFF